MYEYTCMNEYIWSHRHACPIQDEREKKMDPNEKYCYYQILWRANK